jgi:hypothetical protein
VAPHSIDIFHETSIAQIQANLATKTCPVSTDIRANNVAPVIGAVSNYTIPISTPFSLTASASDANGDPLTYCWEQNDNSTTSGTSSVASPTKTTGPNWLSFSPTISPTRTFPQLATILAGKTVTGPLPGGDAATNIEALSSVARTLNFRLTVRDNHPFSSAAPAAVGQTAFTDVVVTVANTGGPFAVTSPNTNVTWTAGGTATVTWSVNGTDLAPINCQLVNILLSTDGGNNFSTVLASATANDGTEVVTVPGAAGTNNRIKVEAVGNIFFDISNTNFTIGAGTTTTCGDATGLTASSITQTSANVSWTGVTGGIGYDVDYKTSSSSTWNNAATGTAATSLTLSGLTAGTTYNWRVRSNCSSTQGSYVQSQFTTTAATTANCPGTSDGASNGTSGGAATIDLNSDIYGTISARGDVDYYKFVIATAGTVTISLTTLPADYQLSLLNKDGTTVLQSSTNAGTADESIGYNIPATGTYYVKVYPKNNGAFNAGSCYTLKVATGTAARMSNSIYVNSPLFLAPNPTSSKANLSFSLPTAGTGTLSVINQTGTVVLKKTIGVNAGDNSKELDFSSLSSGIYFIRLQTAGNTQTTKLVITK